MQLPQHPYLALLSAVKIQVFPLEYFRDLPQYPVGSICVTSFEVMMKSVGKLRTGVETIRLPGNDLSTLTTQLSGAAL